MNGDLVATAATHDVVPQLAALLLSPRIGTLIYWYYELRRLFKKIEELSFSGFHGLLLLVFRIRKWNSVDFSFII